MDFTKLPAKVFINIDGKMRLILADDPVISSDKPNELRYAAIQPPGQIKFYDGNKWNPAEILPLKRVKIQGEILVINSINIEQLEASLNKVLRPILFTQDGVAKIEIKLSAIENAAIDNQALLEIN